MGRRLEQLEEFGIDVVLERRHGVRASILRSILYALSFVYDGLVQLRLYFYRKRVFRERTLGCLVISIGNLTVGGTGKTPIVEKFARACRPEDGEWRFLAVVTKAFRGNAIGAAGSAEIQNLHESFPTENACCSIR